MKVITFLIVFTILSLVFIFLPRTLYANEPEGVNCVTGAMEPSSEYVMIVKIRWHGYLKERSSIEKIIVQPGKYGSIRHKRPEVKSLLEIKPSDLPQLVVVDKVGNVLYRTEFSYPQVMTVPPPPPGSPDDKVPPYVEIENKETSLVIPYFSDETVIHIIDAGTTSPADSKQSIEADFKKKRNDQPIETNPVRPAPMSPGSFNILIISSGYSSTNIANFETAGNNLKQAMLNIEPFRSYSSNVTINVYSTISNLGCYTGCYGIDRLMCCDWTMVLSAAVSSGYPYDEIIVIHNTNTYAGSGSRDYYTYQYNSYNSYCAVYDGSYTSAMALHEFGHSFGDLCDEYTYATSGYSYYDCVNCRQNCSDWSSFSSTCLQGCDVKSDYYRPEESIMLTLASSSYNIPSIKAQYAPDGLEKRLLYFITDVPIISVDKTSLDFGSLITGNTLSSVVTVKNIGTADLNITGAKINGTNVSDFSLSNMCGTILPQSTCSITVTFTPSSPGSKAATLEINSNDPNQATVSISLTGVGVNNDSGSGGGDGGGGCFIATAAYGSYLDPHVKILREFRDVYLLSNPIGYQLVEEYYKLSRPIAAYISEHESFKAITRAILTPVVYGIKNPWFTLIISLSTIILIIRKRKNKKDS
jgi:hypothetical protein